METLVVLGSFGRDKKSYYRLFETTPKHWKVYALSYNDVVPHGKTEKISENILQFLKNHDISSCTVVGHSLGGTFALKFASTHPQKVKRLVLIDSLGVKKHQNMISLFINEIRVQIGNILISRNLKTIYNIEWITTWDVLNNPIMYLRLAQYVAKINLEKAASEINTPTLLIWGKDDYLTPLSDGKKLYQLMRNSKLVVFDGLNHEWILHWPEKLWELL